MRTVKISLLLLLLCFESALAAMYGDFAVPDSLGARLHPAPGHNDRMAVIFPLPSGREMVLYVPHNGQTVARGQVLQTIAMQLDQSRGTVVFDVGGRPWFGAMRIMDSGVAFYDGYTHRNDEIYPLAFSFNGVFPEPEVLQVLSRIHVLPRLRHSPAAGLVTQAYEYFESGDMDNMNQALEQADAVDSTNWVSFYLKGKESYYQGDMPTAALYFRMASTVFSGDSELIARYHGASSYDDATGASAGSLHNLSLAYPEEAAVWEELAARALAMDDIDRAAIYFNEALSANPSSEAALYNLAFIYAEKGDYEQSFRRGREFMHYRPWLPQGIVPDVSGAPTLGQARIQQIMAEPLPIGLVGQYGIVQPAYPTQAQIASETRVIYIEQPVQTYVPGETYYPVITYDWDYHPRYNDYYRKPSGLEIGASLVGIVLGSIFDNKKHDHRRPPPPQARPPHRPGRPGSRPPSWGDNRPGGNRPGDGRPGSNRPGGQRPPAGKPPSGGQNKPPAGKPPSGGQTKPPAPKPSTKPKPAPEVRPTPKPAPKPEARPAPKPAPEVRPTPKPAPKPETRPAPKPAPEVRPTPKPAPKPETRPAAKPAPEVRPTPKPAPKPEAKPAPEVKPAPKPAPKPEVRPAPKPTPKPAPSPRPKPKAKPAPKSEARPAAKPAPKPEARPAAKPAPKPQAKPAPKPSPKPVANVKPAPKPAQKPAAQVKPAPKQVAKPAAAKPAASTKAASAAKPAPKPKAKPAPAKRQDEEQKKAAKPRRK